MKLVLVNYRSSITKLLNKSTGTWFQRGPSQRCPGWKSCVCLTHQIQTPTHQHIVSLCLHRLIMTQMGLRWRELKARCVGVRLRGASRAREQVDPLKVCKNAYPHFTFDCNAKMQPDFLTSVFAKNKYASVLLWAHSHCARVVIECDGSRGGLGVIGSVGSESKCKLMSTFSQVFLLLLNNLRQLSANKLRLVTGLYIISVCWRGNIWITDCKHEYH